MTKTPKILGILWGMLVLTVLCASSGADTTECSSCNVVTSGSTQEVRIEYRDGTERSACGLRCAGAMLGAYRGKDVKTIWIREHLSGKFLDAKRVFWVIGLSAGNIEAFSGRPDAEAFSAVNGGRVVNFGDMMTALFSGMYDGVEKAQPVNGVKMSDDIVSHPECAYCGMDRKKYAHSRVLIRYSDGSEVALCSVHCAGLDLVLHPEKVPEKIMIGTYDRKSLINAEKAFWVLGGSKQGVMSIRGKWAFEKKEDAVAFMLEFGGEISSFRNIMTAAFEDMWEIIR